MKDECIFCKIVNGSIPSKKVFENDNVLAFMDLYPQAPTHILFVHKNHTRDVNEMAQNPNEIGQVFLGIKEYSERNGFDKTGFRVVTNLGKDGGQTVFHTHFHFLAGKKQSGL